MNRIVEPSQTLSCFAGFPSIYHLFVIFLCLFWQNVSAAQSDSDIKKVEKLINDLARAHIPYKYEKKKNWGKQSERWDGLHVQLKNFKLKTKRRKKMVNHGDWKMYSAELIDPKNRFSIKLVSIKKISAGLARVQLKIGAELKLFGRYSKWIKGIQLFSLSADALATVVLDLTLEIKTGFDLKNIPPDLVLYPRVTGADLKVTHFRVLRVSKLGGEFAEQVTQSVRGILDDEVEKQEVKLVQKLNRSIAKKQDKLRLSVRELIDSEWSKLARDFIPDKVADSSKTGSNPATPKGKGGLKLNPPENQ